MKKFISLILSLTIILGMAGCGTTAPANATPADNQVVDGAGRVLEIPKEPDKATRSLLQIYIVEPNYQCRHLLMYNLFVLLLPEYFPIPSFEISSSIFLYIYQSHSHLNLRLHFQQ